MKITILEPKFVIFGYDEAASANQWQEQIILQPCLLGVGYQHSIDNNRVV
jgi:hypothetical protein